MAKGRGWVDSAAFRVRETLVQLLLCLMVGVGLSIYVAVPTWAAAGLAVVMWVGGLLITGPVIFVAPDYHERVTSRQRLGWLVYAALWELLRLGVVTWAGSGAAEAVWIGFWMQVQLWTGVLLTSSFALLSNSRKLKQSRRVPNFGSVLSPWRLIHHVNALAREIGCCLLVAWNPWLIAVAFTANGLETFVADGAWQQKWLDRTYGLVLLGAALVLWLR